MKIRIFGQLEILLGTKMSATASKHNRFMMKQSSKLKKRQGRTLRGLGPGGAPQARGGENQTLD